MQINNMFLNHLFIISLIFIYTECSVHSVNTSDGEINKTMTVYVSKASESIIFYEYQQESENIVLRVSVEAFIQGIQSVLVIVKNGFDQSMSFKLTNLFNSTSAKGERTVCPVVAIRRDFIRYNETLSVELSSRSLRPVNVNVKVYFISDFVLKVNSNNNVSLGINRPRFFLFNFPDKMQQIEVSVSSPNSTCMIFAVESAKCPVYEEINGIKFKGSYQTVKLSGTMTLSKINYRNRQIFIIFVITATDAECNENLSEYEHAGYVETRNKELKVVIKEVKSISDYYLPIFGAIGFYLMFYFVALCISLIYGRHCDIAAAPPIGVENSPIIDVNDATLYGTVEEVADMKTLYSRRQRKYRYRLTSDIENSGTTSSDQSQLPDDADAESYDSCSDISSDPNIYRLNKNLFISDLAKKSPPILNRKYFLYLWYLVIISVFYALPVVQFVITYQQIVRVTGNEDMCFYNFRCTRPLFIFIAFNNIISNIGYVLLGLLFIFITYRRDKLYNENRRFKAGVVDKGLPQYYGLFYAMGLGLTMEGIMSACYHICPSRTNFQFDTAFMYILACLCMIKIYQIRHPDVNASAHSFFMCMAGIIFVGVIGVTYNNQAFWIIFMLIYVLLTLVMSLEIYYLGRWKFRFSFPKYLYGMAVVEKWRCFIPVYKKRMLIIVVNYILNFALSLYGGINAPPSFPTYFLAIFMMNLIIYFLFYVVMKMQYCEHFNVFSIIYIVIAMFCWACAIYCFIKYPTNWQLSPAASRHLNKECIFLEFYDIHDVWHFLSSMSLFFSFLALLTLDDSMFHIERDQIAVF